MAKSMEIFTNLIIYVIINYASKRYCHLPFHRHRRLDATLGKATRSDEDRAHQLECYAFIAIAEGQPPRAAQLLGAAEALRAKVQSPMADNERLEYDQHVGRLRSMLAEKDFNSLWADGRLMSMEQAIELALK